jgi:hypothetical protein
MKANELRIGNLIFTGDDNMVFKVQHGTIRGVLYNHLNVKPIPLTEEWLLKFGFEKAKHWEGGTIYLKNRTHLEIRLYKGEWLAKIYYGVNVANHINLPFKGCVHELQNLYFALEGKELELIENKC